MWETPQCPRRAAQRPPAHGRHNDGVCARLARHRVRRARLSGRRAIVVVSKRAATSSRSPTRSASSGGRAEHRWRVFPQTTARPYAPCHRSLPSTLYTYRGEAWATIGYPHSVHRFNVKLDVAAQCGICSCSKQISRHFCELASGNSGCSGKLSTRCARW